jgi:hypothetical protein
MMAILQQLIVLGLGTTFIKQRRSSMRLYPEVPWVQTEGGALVSL